MKEIQTTVPQITISSKIKELWSTLTIPNQQGDGTIKKFQVEDQQTALFIEPGFVDIFDFEWLTGNIEFDFIAPGMIALSESWAKKSFGSPEAAMDKTMLLDNLVPVKVVGGCVC